MSNVPTSQTSTWWECPKEHQYKTSYDSVVQGNGCPYCGGKKVWQLVEAEVVRGYFRKHALSSEAYSNLAKAGRLPTGFPKTPQAFYKKPWAWFSGNERTKDWVRPEIVRDYFRKHKLTTMTYQNLSKSERLPTGFPGNPRDIYNKPWSWFTGRDRDWVKPEIVRNYVRKNGLTWQSYLKLRKAKRLPEGYPGDPAKIYEKPWSWFTGNDRSWVKLEVVRDYVRKHGLTRPSYQPLWKAGRLPKGFPGNPLSVYNKPWAWFSGNERRDWVKLEVVRSYFQKYRPDRGILPTAVAGEEAAEAVPK